MRNTYLIDFENVGSEGLNGVATLTAEDRVILFYSANSNRMTVRAHQAIVASPAKFDYFEVAVGGKNALDHQLGTYLGYMVATNASERYFIVSHDNGFKFLSTFWLSQDPTLQISMTDTIKASFRVRPSERPRPVQQQNQPKPEPVKEAVEEQPKPVEAPKVEAKPEPVVEMPVEVQLEPVAEAPVVEVKVEVEAKPEPAPASVVEEKPAEVPAAAVEAAPVETAPAGPLPALGSQSRSRSNPSRGRVRSDSILATLKTAKPVVVEEETPAPAPVAVPIEEEKPVAVAEEPTVEIAAVAAEIEALVVEETAPVEEVAAEAVEEPVAETKPSRSRNRRSRNRRKETEPKAEIPVEVKDEPVAETKAPEVPQAEEVTESKPEPKKKAEKTAKTAEPKLYTMSETASAALTALLADHPKLNEARVRELIAGSKKQILCNTLRRQLGQEQGLAVYNQIKKIAYK